MGLTWPTGGAASWKNACSKDTDSEMLYQNAMDGSEGDTELNLQLGLAR
jgi:hypothetical protein